VIGLMDAIENTPDSCDNKFKTYAESASAAPSSMNCAPRLGTASVRDKAKCLIVPRLNSIHNSAVR